MGRISNDLDFFFILSIVSYSFRRNKMVSHRNSIRSSNWEAGRRLGQSARLEDAANSAVQNRTAQVRRRVLCTFRRQEVASKLWSAVEILKSSIFGAKKFVRLDALMSGHQRACSYFEAAGLQRSSNGEAAISKSRWSPFASRSWREHRKMILQKIERRAIDKAIGGGQGGREGERRGQCFPSTNRIRRLLIN